MSRIRIPWRGLGLEEEEEEEVKARLPWPAGLVRNDGLRDTPKLLRSILESESRRVKVL